MVDSVDASVDSGDVSVISVERLVDCVVCIVEEMVDSDVKLMYSEVDSFDSW